MREFVRWFMCICVLSHTNNTVFKSLLNGATPNIVIFVSLDIGIYTMDPQHAYYVHIKILLLRYNICKVM